MVSQGHTGHRSGNETDIKRLTQTRAELATESRGLPLPSAGLGSFVQGPALCSKSMEDSPGSQSSPDPRSSHVTLLVQLEARSSIIPNSLMGTSGAEWEGDGARMGTGSCPVPWCSSQAPRSTQNVLDSAQPGRPLGTQVEVLGGHRSCPSPTPLLCQYPRDHRLPLQLGALTFTPHSGSAAHSPGLVVSFWKLSEYPRGTGDWLCTKGS